MCIATFYRGFDQCLRGFEVGGPGGVRTLDLMTASHARSQLRHRPSALTTRILPQCPGAGKAGLTYCEDYVRFVMDIVEEPIDRRKRMKYTRRGTEEKCP